MPIPHVIGDTGLTFYAKGRPYTVSRDHSAYDVCRLELEQGTCPVEHLIGFVDHAGSLSKASQGRIDYLGDQLRVDGVPLPDPAWTAWTKPLTIDPSLCRFLLTKEGDTITVQGDPDCPDGDHLVKGLDLADPERTLYVEDEEAGFFGFVLNTCVREIRHADARPCQSASRSEVS